MKIAVRRIPSTSQNRSEEPSWSLIRLVAPTGTTKNRPTARTSDRAIVTPQVNPPIGSASSPSSGSSWALAEIARARNPIRSDSPSATTPRITGSAEPVALGPRNQRLRADLDLAIGLSHRHGPGRDPAHHHPLEHRLAADRGVATRDGHPVGHPGVGELRPAVGARRRPGAAPRAPSTAVLAAQRIAVAPHVRWPTPGGPLASAARGPALEPLDPAAGVHQLLLARVEGMALGADLDMELGRRGARVELVPARAANVREHVVGVDLGLHGH